MEVITEKNTKAEILTAYSELEAENSVLKQQLINTTKNEVPGLSDDELAKVDSLLEENSSLKTELENLKNQLSTCSKTFDTSDNVTVVIPYVADFAQGNELALALRGWHKNFRDKYNVVIIGSGVFGLSDLVHVIECDRVSNNPPLDIAHKMLLAIESDVVSEKFIWANDDQYLISPCMLADFEILKCAGKLGETKFGSSGYQQNKKRTFEMLKNLGRGTWDFSTHTPVVFEKDKLLNLIQKYKLTEVPTLIATLYFNYYFPGFVPLQVDNQTSLDHDNIKIGVYRQGADFERLKKLMPGKKLINNSESGWSSKLAGILDNRFPEKCPFEA